MAVIRVFEYERLRLNEKGFKETHFNTLIKFNDQHNNKYFTVGYNHIRFLQYVGVIQVGDLVIEILPKADNKSYENNEEEEKAHKQKWHNVLLDLLQQCKLLKYEALNNANLSLRSKNLLDLYIEIFLNETEHLIYKGLAKKYRINEGNLYVWKGSLQFSKQMSKNLTHQEKFYTKHQVYDVQHPLNQILYEALFVVSKLTVNVQLKSRASVLLLNFPEMSRIKITENTFQNLINRKSEPYRHALELARLILLNYTPDIKTGSCDVLSILFDMNELFEEYIYQQLKRIEDEKTITVSRQQSEYFWESKKIRPDIVIINGADKYVIDTKWKVLTENKPSDDDLKQIYTYNLHFASKHSLLVYPQVNGLENTKGKYNLKYRFGSEEEAHYCQMVFVEIFNKEIDKGTLKRTLGAEILSVFEQHNENLLA